MSRWSPPNRIQSTFGAALLAAGLSAAAADTLGTGRVLTLPREAAAYGRMQHAGLPLQPREVVITFDDGPRPESTPRVLAALAEQGVRASFFLIGEAIERHPELARQVRDAGHTVALHSMAHPELPKLPEAAQLADLKASQQAFERALGAPALAYRFPFLAETPPMRAALAAQRITVMSADAGADDWLPDQTPQMLADRLLQRLEATGGGIVLLHDAQDQTAAETGFMLELSAARPFGAGVVGWADLSRPSAIRPGLPPRVQAQATSVCSQGRTWPRASASGRRAPTASAAAAAEAPSAARARSTRGVRQARSVGSR